MTPNRRKFLTGAAAASTAAGALGFPMIATPLIAAATSMQFAVVMVLQMVFGILASTIVMWFSRQREFRADAGGASLAGRDKMIAALERLKMSHESTLDGQLTAFGINTGKSSMGELFMTHPPLEKRIQALRSSVSV